MRDLSADFRCDPSNDHVGMTWELYFANYVEYLYCNKDAMSKFKARIRQPAVLDWHDAKTAEVLMAYEYQRKLIGDQ